MGDSVNEMILFFGATTFRAMNGVTMCLPCGGHTIYIHCAIRSFPCAEVRFDSHKSYTTRPRAVVAAKKKETTTPVV